MESWCFDSADKGYLSNETISPSDSIFRGKNVLMEWEFRPPISCENSTLVVPDQQSVENPGFPEIGIAEMTEKQFPGDAVRNVFKNNASVGDITSPGVVNSYAISGDEESSSKLSSTVVDSNSRESSLIDLKLGGFCDRRNSNSPQAAPILSSAESLTPAKRIRATSLGCQTAYCQVYGCSKDLSSEKDYHKRHKVCDVHSKTTKVIVNGIDQRFCQQCSRFHLLAEFDDDKRSCRKRLAGHNERRRKPQVGFNGRSGRPIHSYTGSISRKFQGTTLADTSFICQDILGPSHTEKYAANGWGKLIKVEDFQKSANACISEQLHQKSVLPSYNFDKQYAPIMEHLNNPGPGSVFSENITQYPNEMVSLSLFETNSLGSEDLTLFDAASTVQGLPGMSESGCALSLLSSQSQNSPSQSPGMPTANPFIIPGNSPHYSMGEVSEKFLGISSLSFTSRVQSRYSSYKVSSKGRNHLNGMPVLDNDDSVNSDLILQGSEFMNVKDHLSCEDETTIDLLQLSSQLQRVENQRHSGLVKQENDGFCCLRMT